MFGVRLRYSLPLSMTTLTLLVYGYYQAWVGG